MAYSSKTNVRHIHWTWVILAILALAIPLTLFILSQNTDNRQQASGFNNPVVRLDLKGECNGKNEPKNSFRRAEYQCQNGVTGVLPNNNNSCDRRPEWMDKAEKRCRAAATAPTVPSTTNPSTNSTPIPTIIIADPPSGTPASSPTSGIVHNPYVLNCSAVGQPVIGDGGVMLSAQLLYGNGNPIYNANIQWKTEPALINTQSFSSTTKTASQGNGATHNFIPPGQGSLSSIVVTVMHDYIIPGTQTNATAECKITLTAN